ncbi:serine hydrolase domain-containing protein [uncultured Chitinophaga sp.]|jgi:Beta-lactamase class C and other penicillin binding proteins|uniref:serine hydrolase domain-containing protein n=1 Tax=uncultured Chitinophaga sp. TaxID=339340 RepID=UPI00262F8D22|nr:serine hydrolase domain-containing protein [uncultured Chitinophaga sp.]
MTLFAKLNLAGALIAFACHTTAQTKDHNIDAQIDSIFAEYNTTPGVAVAIVKDGAVVFRKGYGLANLEYGIPITPQTVFHVASVSKQFTAYSIYLLKEQGKLSLEDDVRKYIPELPQYGKTIRIKHLLAHTSGLRDQWALLTLAGWQMEDIITTTQILKLAAKQKQLNFEPGTMFRYSNTGYTLLAEIVSRVSKQTFADFTAANIFRPLGMQHTRFNDDFHNVVKNKAHSYEMINGRFIERPLHYSTVGATSLLTTVEDLAKWVNNFDHPVVGNAALIAAFNDVSLFDNGQPVIWAASAGDTTYHAKGQLLWKHRGLKVRSHGGHDAGYRAVLINFPEQRLSVITLSNNEHYTMIAKVLPVANLFLANELAAAAPPATTVNQAAMAEQAAGYHNTLSDYTGKYHSDELSTDYNVTIKDGKLILTHHRLNDMELKPAGKDEFAGENDFAFTIRFVRDRQQVTGFEISNFGVQHLRFTLVH